ncbi:hypothetical protein BX666DRAFT_2109025 [Dichotomocladium elegans]|nr:hypothetical protein BX666DRAFT_2109025 [Dichotomocladium elegans]
MSTPSHNNLLQDVLSKPKMLRSFESYLRRVNAHENLLFIEAMAQLRHDHNSTNFEVALNRIYKSFLAENADLRLTEVTTKQQVEHDMESLHWAIIRREDAVDVLRETEEQVLAILQTKLDDFIRSKNIDLRASEKGPYKHQIRVVIIGGGFTGFTVAAILDPMPLFHVTVIDTKDSFEYTPGIIKTIVNPEECSSMRVRHDAYVKNGRVIIGYATKVSDDAKSVVVNGETIELDYLVIATGSSYNSQLKSTDISVLYRSTGLEHVSEELAKARRVLIVGGGLVGCELASEIALRTFPGDFPHKHITLVESHDKVISRSDPGQRERAMDYLSDLGIEVVCNERIVDLEGTENNGNYLGSSGRIYSGYDKVFMATGTRPNSQLIATSPTLECCVDNWGRINVKPTLQVDHYKYRHIFAGGDVTNIVEEKTGYAATLAGVCIARNICRLVKGKEPLRQGTKGTMPAPERPLHGISSQGGIGKQKLGLLKKKFAFLNPAWAALKLFDEKQFLRMVQGESMGSSHGIGRLPRRLLLPIDGVNSLSRSTSSLSLSNLERIPSLQRQYNSPMPKQSRSYAHTSSRTSNSLRRDFKTWGGSSRLSTVSQTTTASTSSSSSIHEFMNNHFQFASAHTLDSQHHKSPSMGDAQLILETTLMQSKRHYRRSSMPSIHSMDWSKADSTPSVSSS